MTTVEKMIISTSERRLQYELRRFLFVCYLPFWYHLPMQDFYEEIVLVAPDDLEDLKYRTNSTGVPR